MADTQETRLAHYSAVLLMLRRQTGIMAGVAGEGLAASPQAAKAGG